jgi:UDP:flavonoid glycosyltransferase YjiC (YdhE family)
VPLAMLTAELPPPGLGLRPAKGRLGRLRDRVLHRVVGVATRGIQRAYEEQRVALGLAPNGLTFVEACFSPDLVCATGVARLEYPRSDLPTHVEFVGSLTLQPGERPSRPDWWPQLDEYDEVMHVTQGTLNVDPTDLIAPTLEALGRQRVAVVAATGRRGVPELPFPTPPNAFVGGLVDYDELLPRVHVMITNGGWGGVLAALSHGIPLIVAGGDIDKPEIAARVAWAGAGIDLRTGRPRARAVLDAWRRIGADPAYRAAAERLGEELRRHDGPHEVVEHTMRLIAVHAA